MLQAIEDEVFVNLIADDENIVISHNFTKPLNIVLVQDGFSRIMRGVKNNCSCFAVDSLLYRIPVNFITRILEFKRNSFCAIDLDIGNIAVVSGFKKDH